LRRDFDEGLNLKYLQRSFSVGLGSDDYNGNYDAVFGRQKAVCMGCHGEIRLKEGEKAVMLCYGCELEAQEKDGK